MNFSTLNTECNNEETLQEEFQALRLSTRKQEHLLVFVSAWALTPAACLVPLLLAM